MKVRISLDDECQAASVVIVYKGNQEDYQSFALLPEASAVVVEVGPDDVITVADFSDI